jgi:hypothetical protein
MTDCLLLPHPTNPTLCWCESCQRTLPIRLLHARRNCRIPPVPRSEAEQAVCEAACAECQRQGQIEGEPICGLDLAAINREKVADLNVCVKRALKERRRRRVAFREKNECGPFRAALAREEASSRIEG